MKYSLAFFAFFLLTLSACAPKEPAREEGIPPSMREEREQEPVMEEPMPEPEEEETDTPPVSGTRVIEISADNWSFTPSAITAKKGEMLEVRLVGVGGVHGFAAPGLGITASVNPGESVSVTIPTMEAGTYEFFCSIPCGSGHREMRGTITIEP